VKSPRLDVCSLHLRKRNHASRADVYAAEEQLWPYCHKLIPMRTSHRRIHLFYSLFLVAYLSGCASGRAGADAGIPTVDGVCLRIAEVREPERALLARKAALLLREGGFRTVDEGCELTVAYTALDTGQWEIMTSSILGLRSRTSYRAEGVVSVSHRAKIVVADEPVNVRNHATKSDLVDALAWEVARQVTDSYRPAPPRQNSLPDRTKNQGAAI
jgi:hypothetical protein